MELGAQSPRKVSAIAHPVAAVVISVIGLVCGLGAVIFTQQMRVRVERMLSAHEHLLRFPVKTYWLLRMPWTALSVGIVVGFVAILIQKQLLKSHVTFYADFYTLPVIRRFQWSILKVNLLVALPALLGPYVGIGVACLLKISPLPAFCGTSICWFLAYPECKLIYAAAQDRLRATAM